MPEEGRREPIPRKELLRDTTPVPNVIIDEWMPHLSPAEVCVVLYVARRTRGWARDQDQISVRQMTTGIMRRGGKRLDHGTGLGETACRRAVRSLVARGALRREEALSENGASEPPWYALDLSWVPERTSENRLRELLDKGTPPPDPDKPSPYGCPRCRDSGWITDPATDGYRRCPHAAAEDRRIRLEYHIKKSGTGELGRTQTFETFDADKCADPDTRRVTAFLKDLATDPAHAINEGISGKRGLLITGPTGAGKSHLLRATTIRARERGVLAVFVEVYRLIRRVQDSYGAASKRFVAPGEAAPETASQILDSVASAEIVCLDDLGAEQHTEHNTQVLFELLDTLASRNRTVVVSTNLSGEELGETYGDRILSRLSGLARMVNLAAERDHRAS